MAKSGRRPRLTTAENPRTIETHKLELARELLDDIELSRLNPEQLLLKAARLARLVEEQEVRQWLELELRGYYDSDIARKYMERFGRWTQKEKNMGYWKPLASIAAWAAALQIEIQQLRIPDLAYSPQSANPNELVAGFAGAYVKELSTPVKNILDRLQNLTTTIAQLREIQSRVVAEIHSFAVQTYYRLAFSGAAESIFRAHQHDIDRLLRDKAADVLEKIPSITARLSEDDREAVSQALNSCRRMVQAFADAVQPAAEGEVEDDGERYEIGSAKVLNRIQYYLSTNCPSKGRRDRLNKNLRTIWDRASAGTHKDVTPNEAKALFLQTYLTLGEILAACVSTQSRLEDDRQPGAASA